MDVTSNKLNRNCNLLAHKNIYHIISKTILQCLIINNVCVMLGLIKSSSSSLSSLFLPSSIKDSGTVQHKCRVNGNTGLPQHGSLHTGVTPYRFWTQPRVRVTPRIRVTSKVRVQTTTKPRLPSTLEVQKAWKWENQPAKTWFSPPTCLVQVSPPYRFK